MAIYEIPLSPQPQQFTITLAGVEYICIVQWNNQANVWTISFNDVNNNPILAGVPLVTGADLLAQYAYLNFGGQLGCYTDADLTAPPSFTNLGVTSHLLFNTTS